MAEALVSAVIEQLVSILRQQAEERIRLIAGADDEVEKLTSNFQAIKAVLGDAENKQVKDSSVRDWLEKLRDVSYGIDDVLDEWNTALLKLRIEEAENASKPLGKVCSVVSYYLCCFYRVVFRCDIAIKIKNLNRRLDIIATEKDRYNFSSKNVLEELERPITTSDIDVSEVRGRNEDMNALVNLLLSENSQAPTIPVISIVGMGGIGKTTLARLAYNHDSVKAHFNEKIWVCVSEPFDQIRIAKEILESLRNEAPNLHALETVMRNIRDSIQGKKFLLVLDDVWTENSKDWEPLKNSLMCGSPGSRILVTTRKETVANVIGTAHLIRIGSLPENECWSLFSQLAFSGRTKQEYEELKSIGENIVQRCKGLPLAIKTLGSLLRFKRNIKEWQIILNSEMWEVEEVERGLFPPLLLSYYDLPSVLKKCFSYCAIFPKDYRIEKDELIRLWMSQGYLKAKPNEDEEFVGEMYFQTLSVRSLFQDFQKDEVDSSKIIRCKMHDIVHDFVQFLTKNECFTLEVDDSENSLSEFKEKGRHLTMIAERDGSFPVSVYTVKNLRSLVFDCKYLSGFDLGFKFDRLTCLRTLSLARSSISELRGIENLVHLRYLKLSGNIAISELPETLCELYNLQILDVFACQRLKKLPQGIGRLINLRYLYCNWSSISYMPKGVERLTRVERLEYFVVSESDDGRKACKLGCLKNFNHLKSLAIKGLGNLADLADLRSAQLNNKRHLVHLDLNFQGQMNEDDQEGLVEAVQPPPQLEFLLIGNYRGKTVFPNWLMSLIKLRILRLGDCLNCEHLPPLGKLPSLESLEIHGTKSIRRVGNEFLGIESDIATSSSSSSAIAFPKLKRLYLWNMEELEEWDYGITEIDNYFTIMPCLRILQLYSCPKLKSMPSHLLPMTTSNDCRISSCPLLEEHLEKHHGGRQGR